jgi:hypothetical protein
MNRENNSRESVDTVNEYHGLVDLVGKTVVCFPLLRQVSELTIDSNHFDDTTEDSHNERTVVVFCQSYGDKTISNTIQGASDVLDTNRIRTRKQSIDLLNQHRPRIGLTLSNERLDVGFSKRFRSSLTSSIDSSPKMPTRIKTMASLENMFPHTRI